MKSRTRTRNKPAEQTDPMQAAYAAAEGLAIAAVRQWGIRGGNEAEDRRANDLGTVYHALIAADTHPDPQSAIETILDRHFANDRAGLIEASDTVTFLYNQAIDAGYLYGLAVGIAMSKGGAR